MFSSGLSSKTCSNLPWRCIFWDNLGSRKCLVSLAVFSHTQRCCIFFHDGLLKCPYIILKWAGIVNWVRLSWLSMYICMHVCMHVWVCLNTCKNRLIYERMQVWVKLHVNMLSESSHGVVLPRLPNHWWAISWEITAVTRCLLTAELLLVL